MSEPLSSLERLVHEPARLAIMTALSACHTADYLFILQITGLNQGNFAGHLAKLEAAGLVDVDKRFVGKRPRTRVALTRLGTTTLKSHWARLEALRARFAGLDRNG